MCVCVCVCMYVYDGVTYSNGLLVERALNLHSSLPHGHFRRTLNHQMSAWAKVYIRMVVYNKTAYHKL